MSTELAEIGSRLDRLEARVAQLERRGTRAEAMPALPAPPRSPSPPSSYLPPSMAGWPAPGPEPKAAPTPGRRTLAFEDLLGGRVLAVAGGIAVVLAAVFFLSLAVERGWIGPAARLAVAAVVSAVLVGVGIWLHERRGRTQAAQLTAAAGIAGLLLCLMAATPGYDLLPARVTLPAAGAVGILATALAVRWSTQAFAWLGIGAGLLAPVLLAAPSSAETLAFLVITYAAASAVAAVLRWNALWCTAFLLTWPQVAIWAVGGIAPRPLVTTLALVGVVGLTAAGVAQRRALGATDATVALLVVAANAWWLATLGATGLAGAAGTWWVVAVVAAHVVTLTGGMRAVRDHVLWRGPGSLATVAALLVLVDGVLWFLSQVAPERELLVASLATLTTVAFATGRWARSGAAARTVDGLGVFALALVNVATLEGWVLLVVLLGEALVLCGLAVGDDDYSVDLAAGGLWVVALGQVLATDVPPRALLEGVASVPAALAALGLVGLAAAGAALLRARTRPGWWIALAVTGGYLSSVLVVTGVLAAPPSWPLGAGTDQGAQVALGALWTITGATALWAGLRRDAPAWRRGGLVLLALAAGKAVFYDLSELELGYRAASFLGLGLLLLAGAHAYQRLRTPAGDRG